MATIDIRRTVSLDGPVQVEPLSGVAFTAESGAHRFVISARKGGEAVALSGSVVGAMILADGTSYPALSGSIESGAAVLTLPAAAYGVPGRFQLVIYNVAGSVRTAVYGCVGTIMRTQTDSQFDPGAVVPSATELAGMIQQLEDAIAQNLASVRYDEPQTLTEEQKAQVRENIGTGTLGPNILCSLKPENSTIKVDYATNGDYFEVENTGTNTYRGLSSAVDMQKYLVPGKRYHMHMTADVLSGTPYVTLAIRDSNNAILLRIGSGASGTSGDFSADFVATSEMYKVTLFMSMTTSTQGSKARFTDVSIREYIAAWSMEAGNFTPVNVLDPMADDVEHGKFISDFRNGAFTWTTNANYDESGYIEAHWLDRLYFTRASRDENLTYNANGLSIAVYDADKQPICALYPGAKSDGTCYIMPQGTAYVRVPIYKQTLVSIYIVPANVTVPDGIDWYYVPYGKRMLSDLKTHWYGKTWYAYGTSITNTASEGKYANYLAKFGGLVHVNKGISGGGIGDFGAHSTGQVYNAICNITDGKLEADLITLETGANDTGDAVPLGTIYDTGTSTLSGCLNDCIRYLQTNTDAQIVVFSSPSSTTVPTPESHKYYEWAEMVERICALNRVRYIKPSTNMGPAKLASGKGSLYVVDTIHQTELGGYVYAETIWSELKDIPLFFSEMPHV